MSDDPRRRIPAVHRLMNDVRLHPAIEEHGREAVREAVRRSIDAMRAAVEPRTTAFESIIESTLSNLEFEYGDVRPVINGTGILLHTGLGRAPLGPEVAAEVAHLVAPYSDLEITLDEGHRGSRTRSIEGLLRRLTGAEAATVVNNNAAATVLTLRALAAGREVVVSRGQLVEIGGNYRLPDVFEASGARLREVGTTNKTRLDDFARAIGPDTAALLRVHPSNYRIVGFVEEVPIAALARLARDRGLIVIDDVGSGALAPGAPPGLPPDEPTIRGSLDAGADIVLASGDKLLGGPQSGLVLGRATLVARIVADPLYRAVRVGKLTISALQAVLRRVRSSARTRCDIPLWRMLATPPDELRRRAEALIERLGPFEKYEVNVGQTNAELGGGSAPVFPIPSFAIRIEPRGDRETPGASSLAADLRRAEPPVLARVQDRAVWIDLRTVFPDQDEKLAQVLGNLVVGAEPDRD